MERKAGGQPRETAARTGGAPGPDLLFREFGAIWWRDVGGRPMRDWGVEKGYGDAAWGDFQLESSWLLGVGWFVYLRELNGLAAPRVRNRRVFQEGGSGVSPPQILLWGPPAPNPTFNLMAFVPAAGGS